MTLPDWVWLRPEEFSKDNIWWEIYTDSFPIAEQDSREQILKALENNIAVAGSYQLQGATVAIAVYYPIQSPTHEFIFLNYIAVRRSARNQGLGKQLLDSIIRHSEKIIFNNGRYPSALIWEVEDPADALEDKEKILRKRRLEFYKRAGARLFKHAYIQPPIDGIHEVPMRLMYYPPGQQVNATDYEFLITAAIYHQKYKVVNNISPEILQILLNRTFSHSR